MASVVRVKSMTLEVVVTASVDIPSYIRLDPSREGVDWYVRYTTLYYRDENGDMKEYDLDSFEYDGDYKRPEVVDMENEVILEEEEEEEVEKELCYACKVEEPKDTLVISTGGFPFCDRCYSSLCGSDWEEAKFGDYKEYQRDLLRGK
jgi:hypothetical protein